MANGADADGILAQSVGATERRYQDLHRRRRDRSRRQRQIGWNSLPQSRGEYADQQRHDNDARRSEWPGCALDGGAVAITNSGSIVGAVDLNGTLGSSGPEAIANSGQIIGNVAVDSSTSVTVNGGGGTFGSWNGGTIRMAKAI